MKQSTLLTAIVFLGLAATLSIPAFSTPLGTAFTYQGQLVQSGVAADSDFDFKFNLLDGPDPLSANELASATILAVTVTDGLFTVEIDFGAVFTGDAVWLETEVRPAGVGGLTSLFPPHQLTATPYALNAERFGGLEVSEVVTMEVDPTVNTLAQANLTCSNGEVAKIDGGGIWSCGEDVDTTLDEDEVDGFVSNNGFLTSESDPTVQANVKDGVVWSELGSSIPSDIADGDQVGITSESDPTVPAHVKDGITWLEIANRPPGLDDGDHVGLTSVSWSQIKDRPLSVDGAGRIGIGVDNPQNKLHVDGIIRANGFANSTNDTICRQASGAIADCSSSIRYKRDVQNMTTGMEVIEKLRPVTFRWKNRDEESVGFIAEEIAETAPLFVTYRKGQIEGVRYGELTTLLVNAFKEQQAEIDQLRALVCAGHTDQEVCQ